MKKILLASVATLATVSAFSAFAADLPSRKAAPVYAPPPPMWTGFYAGLNAGYNFGTNRNGYSQNWGGNWVNSFPGAGALPGVAALATSAMASNTQSGFIGGGQVGYNYQYGSNVVIGVEADIQGSGIRGTGYGGGAGVAGVANPGVPPQPLGANGSESAARVVSAIPFTDTTNTAAVGQTSVQSGVDWLGTVRGRIGYLWTPTLLVYGTGGLAYGNAYANVVQSAVENVTRTQGTALPQTSYEQTNTWLGGGRQNQILTGWTAGGGAEWLFAPNWSVKAEALYWDLGRQNVQTSLIGVSGRADRIANNFGSGRTSVSYQGVIARAGVNYHFNWGAALVVASY